ncbi:MAG: hypothetical protein MR434_01990 [Ruminococcus sp.]|nr:hypothetical protein [Ruminococcus sp.]
MQKNQFCNKKFLTAAVTFSVNVTFFPNLRQTGDNGSYRQNVKAGIVIFVGFM